MFKENRTRSFIKMLSWRVWATLTTMILVFIFTGKFLIAVSVGVVEVVAKMLLYYIHERIWDKIRIGRQESKPFVLWFTGLPSSGKSTLADKTYEYLSKKGYKVERLDGDVVRSFFPNTGFSKEERNTHIKRVGFLASLLENNGVSVVSSFVSPYEESREFVRNLCDNFIQVYVSTPLEECERRDVKGLYKKARAGEISNFTGISDPYQAPKDAQIVIDTSKETEEDSFKRIKKYISSYM